MPRRKKQQDFSSELSEIAAIGKELHQTILEFAQKFGLDSDPSMINAATKCYALRLCVHSIKVKAGIQ